LTFVDYRLHLRRVGEQSPGQVLSDHENRKKELIAEEGDWQRANEIIERFFSLRGEEQ